MNRYISHGECLKRWPQLRSLRLLNYKPKDLSERWELNQLESIVRHQSPDMYIGKELVYSLIAKYNIKSLPLPLQPVGKESFRDFISKYPGISEVYHNNYRYCPKRKDRK